MIDCWFFSDWLLNIEYIIKWQRLRCCHFFCRGCRISRPPFLFTLIGLFTVNLHNLGRFSAYFLCENVLLKVRFLAFRVQNSIKSPFSEQESMVFNGFQWRILDSDNKANRLVFSMLRGLRSWQPHYCYLYFVVIGLKLLTLFRLKKCLFLIGFDVEISKNQLLTACIMLWKNVRNWLLRLYLCWRREGKSTKMTTMRLVNGLLLLYTKRCVSIY